MLSRSDLVIMKSKPSEITERIAFTYESPCYLELFVFLILQNLNLHENSKYHKLNFGTKHLAEAC